MADSFNPLGTGIPGFDINQLCPIPDDFTAEELAVLEDIVADDLSRLRVKLAKIIGKARERITTLETKADTAQSLLQTINSTLANHEARISALEGS